MLALLESLADWLAVSPLSVQNTGARKGRYVGQNWP